MLEARSVRNVWTTTSTLDTNEIRFEFNTGLQNQAVYNGLECALLNHFLILLLRRFQHANQDLQHCVLKSLYIFRKSPHLLHYICLAEHSSEITMESMKTILFFAAATLFLVAIFSGEAMGLAAEPRRLVVGDEAGWRLNFDYAAWAAANPVRVTDILVFNYDNTTHTVTSLNTKEEFDSCDFTSPKKNRASGFSNVVMAEDGPRYYACSIGQHCKNGMKLVVDVQA